MKSNPETYSIGPGVCSMTGFGTSAQILPGRQITVEIRTVNNRFCEIGLRIPREINALEGELRERLRRRIARGKVSLLISITRDGQMDTPLHFDLALAQACYQNLRELNLNLGSKKDPTLDQLLHFSDYFLQELQADPDETVKGQILSVLDAAVDNLSAMRRQEGVSLAQDLLARLGQIEEVVGQIETLAVDQPRLHLERLRERLTLLTASESLDPGRLEMEMALIADRLDITEECVRMRSHCQIFRETLAGSEPPGKRLGFLLQEMNREVNTMGSKSLLADIAHRTVAIKEELERMREQIQNLE